MTDLNILPMEKEHLTTVWPTMHGLMGAYLDKAAGRVRQEDVFNFIVEGEWNVWIVWDQKNETPKAFICVSIATEPSGKKSARIEMMIGEDRKQWLGYIPLIEEWALEQECDYIDMMVPKAFARDLPDYFMTHVFLQRAL